MSAPGTARPGGRTAKVAEAVFAATVAELTGRDYADISIESIAARSGVHKTTIYRRWGSKPELIRQVMLSAASERIPAPDSGSAADDLAMLAHSVQAILSDPASAAITSALITGATSAPEIADVMQRFWAARLAAFSDIVQRGIRRGQLPAGTDPAALMQAVAAPLYYRLLVSRAPITPREADRSVAAALAAAAAGVYANAPDAGS
jgi:AcrR family transcriptional regulator